MNIHTIDLENIRYSALVELLQKTKGTFRNYVFILGKTEYYLTGLTYTSDAEGGQYKFSFHVVDTEEEPLFKSVYIDKELDRQRHVLPSRTPQPQPRFKKGGIVERPTRELHLTALEKLLLENNITLQQ